MADTKLILQVDDLDHKLISVDSEVAVNETFDIVFEGLSETEVGSTATVTLQSQLRKEVIWLLEDVIQQLDDGTLVILGCKINTQNALDITRITSAKTILTLVLTDDYGNRTVYGTAQMRLHPGYGESGEPLEEIERSVEKHNVDPEAHKELFQSLRDADASILQEVDEKIEDNKNAEIEARNKAIGDAVNQAKDEMENAYKGDLTDFATAAATSARAAASSANAAAIAADKTVEKLSEAYEVVNTLNGKISQVDGKVEVAGRYAESAEGAAGRANTSKERAVTAEENIGVYVTQVSGLAAGIKQDADRAASAVSAVNDAKVAVETAKRQVEGLAEEVEGYKQTAVNAATAAGESASNAEGSANTAKGHADRAEEAEARANNYVNVELPNKVAILDQSIDDKMSAVDAHLESAQTAIIRNIDSKANEVSTTLDGKVTEANDAKTDAVNAKDDAVTAKGQAEGFATQASNSASNASTSATQAKTSETNAKASAVQAENATALKVDQRINTADNSEYPLVVMVDKDVYKFIAPKGATNRNDTRYCCDGTGHYFYGNGRFYEYDTQLKLVRSFKYNPGQHMGQNQLVMSVDFCTRIGDHFFLRHCAYPYTTQKLMKYDLDGNLVAELLQDRPNVVFRRICRNEQSGHLIIFDRFTDVADDGSTVYRMGYFVYDENLNLIRDTDRLDCDVPSSGSPWLYHFNIPSNVTLVTFAPTDATKTALYYLDKNDKIVEVDANVIRGKGAFTSSDLTATGRTSANYAVPRVFYGILYRGQFHDLHVINNAKLYRILVYPNTDNGVVIKKGTDSGLGGYGDLAIKATSVPNNRLVVNTLVPANGGGNAAGFSTVYQNYASIANSIVTKPFSYLNLITDFAPDPFVNSASISVDSAGNTHPVFNNTAATNAYHLFPAGSFNVIGGAIMFTL